MVREAEETNRHIAWFSFSIMTGCKQVIKMFLCLPKVVENNEVTEFRKNQTLCCGCNFSTLREVLIVIIPKSACYFKLFFRNLAKVHYTIHAIANDAVQTS